MNAYLSAAWFARCNQILGDQPAAVDRGLIVEHVLAAAPLHRAWAAATDSSMPIPRRHWMWFDEGALRSWLDGPAPRPPHLRIHRTEDLDRGDLLGRANTQTVADGTRISFPISTDPTLISDPIGITSRHFARTPAIDSDLVVADIIVRSSPFGRLDVRLRVERGQFVGATFSHGSDATLTLDTSFDDLLDWLHGGSTLGNLLLKSERAGGDLIEVSHLEGCIRVSSDAAAEARARHTLRVLGDYATARNVSTNQFDLIEGETSIDTP